MDEAQDTNAWQVEALRKLRIAGAKITLIGDPDQCIFEFSLASVSTLKELKDEWNIPEKPLDKSFRCNNAIADSVKVIGSNAHFQGCGAPINQHAIPYVIGDANDSYTDSIAFFEKKLADAGIALHQAAIISRGHNQITNIVGTSPFTKLEGKARELAQAVYERDVRKDFQAATEKTYRILRGFDEDGAFAEIIDEHTDSEKAQQIHLCVWKFLRDSNRLPALSDAASVWLEKVKTHFAALLSEVGINTKAKMGLHFKRTGLTDEQMTLPLHTGNKNIAVLRTDTIHKVKGEGIDAVLVVGSEDFFNDVVKSVESNEDTEQRRLCYVAMTRAKHLLVVATPNGHYTKNKQFWVSRNFQPGN